MADEPVDYYEVLQEAQKAATEAVRPRVTASSVDEAARQIITAAGYGDHFIHRTGHGIGLEAHEEPWIVAGNSAPLSETRNMAAPFINLRPATAKGRLRKRARSPLRSASSVAAALVAFHGSA